MLTTKTVALLHMIASMAPTVTTITMHKKVQGKKLWRKEEIVHSIHAHGDIHALKIYVLNGAQKHRARNAATIWFAAHSIWTYSPEPVPIWTNFQFQSILPIKITRNAMSMMIANMCIEEARRVQTLTRGWTSHAIMCTIPILSLGYVGTNQAMMGY